MRTSVIKENTEQNPTRIDAGGEGSAGLVNARPEAATGQRLQGVANNTPRSRQGARLQQLATSKINGQPTAVAQLQVVQRIEADEERKKAEAAFNAALDAVETKDYVTAIAKHKVVKDIAGVLHHHKDTGKNTKIYARHLGGKEEVLGVDQMLRKLSEKFAQFGEQHLAVASKKVEGVLLFVGRLNEEYQQGLLVQMAQGHKEGAKESQQNLKNKIDKADTRFKEVVAELTPLYKFHGELGSDADLEYVRREGNIKTGGEREDETTTIGGTGLKTFDFSTTQDKLKELKGLLKDLGSKTLIKEPVAAIKKPISEDKQGEAFTELAGGEDTTRLKDLLKNDQAALIAAVAQIKLVQPAGGITAFYKLVDQPGISGAAPALELVKLTGKRGDIDQLNSFWGAEASRTSDDKLADFSALLREAQFDSLASLATRVAKYPTAIGYPDLKFLLNAKADGGKLEGMEELLALAPIASGKFKGNRMQIALAFTRRTGGGSTEDWKNFLSMTLGTWEQLTNAALAFDKSPGGLTSKAWVTKLTEDATLLDAPREVPGSLRLDKYAGEDWYDGHDMSKLGSTDRSKKKYTRLLQAMLGSEKLSKIKGLKVDELRGDFLPMLAFFHRHIAAFKAETGEGFDRDGQGGRDYLRSNMSHPAIEGYTKATGVGNSGKDKVKPPLNQALAGLQGYKATTKKTSPLVQTGRQGVASAGLPANNLKVLRDHLSLATAKKDLPGYFGTAVLSDDDGRASRRIDDQRPVREALAGRQKENIKGKVNPGHKKGGFHDNFLQDRGKVVSKLSAAINGISGGAEVVKAIGSEGHPSLLLLVPRRGKKYCYGGEVDYSSTDPIVAKAVTDFNSAVGQELHIIERGSFGFQRPSMTDTADSIRFWPGYAPVESLLPGLKVILRKLAGVSATTDLPGLDEVDKLVTNTDEPVAHVEALKAAMRHALIVREKKIALNARPEKKRVYRWLQDRLLIKLQQATVLLDKASTIYKSGEKVDAAESSKHFRLTADTTDKIQEYAMLYTATVLPDTDNRDAAGTGVVDDQNVYASMVKSRFGGYHHRIFYLDSGEQALITAGILANRFDKQVAANADAPAKSKYRSLNPYFEVSTFGGDGRSNLEKTKTKPEHDNAPIIHADLSPVITGGITAPKPAAEIREEVANSWREGGARGGKVRAKAIPIIDITNSSLDEVKALGELPDQFIVVESLTKHQQLGADKFIMGRMVVASKTDASGDASSTKNFMDLAVSVVGPVAKDAYNPLLSAIRENMDKALYTDKIA